MDFTALRAMVTRNLDDTCVIRGRGTALEFDTTTREYVDASPGDVVYDGPCRLRSMFRATGLGTVATIGDTQVPLAAFEVKLPWDTTGIRVDQVLTVTSSSDPELVGRSFRVIDVQGETSNVYRQIACEDLQAVDAFAGEGS